MLVLQKKIKIAEETEKDFVNGVDELFKAENIIVEPSELLISMIRREMKFQLREDHWSSILKRRENLLN